MTGHDPVDPSAAIAVHRAALATVRDFAERSGAARVVALVDVGDGRTAAVVEAERGGALALGDGETALPVPERALRDTRPLAVEAPRAVPATALRVDAETGRVEAPLGAVENLGRGVLDLARALGGRSVATAEFDAAEGLRVTIAARVGEPLILAVGDQQFELTIDRSAGD